MNNSNSKLLEIKNRLNHLPFLEEEYLNALAKDISFVQRSNNRLSGSDFFRLMSIEHFQNNANSLEALCDILLRVNPDVEMTPQALNQKINSQNAVKFLKRIFELKLRHHHQTSHTSKIDDILLKAFEPFGNVYLQDSTQMELDERLSEEFRGSGGSASKAGLKIDLIYEYIHHELTDIIVSQANVSDQKRSQNILRHLKEGDLVIRDLGYFTLDIFRKIAARGAFFLTRYKHRCKVYLSNQEDADPINLGQYLKKNMKDKNVMELYVFLGGKKKAPGRMVFYRMPENVANERIRKAKKNAKKKGVTLSQEHLALLKFGLYITNVSREVFQAEVIGTIYRLRWQIELIFKQWKQLFQIHVMAGSRRERIYCLIYARLTLILIATAIYSAGAHYAMNEYKREVSPDKLIQWLQRCRRLGKAIWLNRIGNLLDDLITAIPKYLLKQKRKKRKTTLELIQEECPYLESFQNGYNFDTDGRNTVIHRKIA
jgi:IS4 transposase